MRVFCFPSIAINLNLEQAKCQYEQLFKPFQIAGDIT